MKRWFLLAALALAVRWTAAWWLGPGSFGPDAPGAEAAVILGGHPYPLHPIGIQLLGARGLSVISGVVTVLACAALGLRWGRCFWGPGLAAACAPLLVYPSALAGGDAAAIALASVGLALAAVGRGFAGGVCAAASLWAKPIALPLIPLLLVTPSPLLAGAGAGATLLVSKGLLAPLLAPKPRAGLLGSWWVSSDGIPPSVGAWRDLLFAGVERLWDLPHWTGHPVLGLLALFGVFAWQKGRIRRALVWATAAACLALTATLLGDVLRPRYLGAASLPLTVLAGIALGRVAPLALTLLWPTAALITQVAALRATEEGLTERLVLDSFAVDAAAEFRDGGVCGATELRATAATLASDLPLRHEVVALRLRDGRQNDLLWPLQAARQDLRVTVFHAGCCDDLGAGACAAALRFHLEQGATLVAPLTDHGCTTALVDPGEAPLLPALAPLLVPGSRYGLSRHKGVGSHADACRAVTRWPER